MRKITLTIAMSVMALTGCQNMGGTYKNMVQNADSYRHKEASRAVQNPKTVQKCWNNLAKFEQMTANKPRFANFNANRLESKLHPQRTIWGTETAVNPCLYIPNYVPAAQQAIARARFIGSNSRNY